MCKKTKGYTLLEVLCAMGIASIMLTCSLNMLGNTIRLKEYNNYMKNNLNMIEILKNKLLFETAFEKLEKYSEESDVIELNNKKLGLEELKASNIEDLIILYQENQPKVKIYFKKLEPGLIEITMIIDNYLGGMKNEKKYVAIRSRRI